jgi:hypothetical protein
MLGMLCGIFLVYRSKGGKLMRSSRTAAIAFHLFNLLFLRWKSGTWAFAISLLLGWVLILVIVILGPFAIQTPEKGPYFGPSGSWYVCLLIYQCLDELRAA